jgi:hypothetical protein
MKYIGAHYTLTPNNSVPRNWAGGGLRDPGGNRTSYSISSNGAGGYTDTALTEFLNKAVPVIDELLTDGSYAVVSAGAITSDTADMFLESMESDAGQVTFRESLHARVDAIQASAHASGWEQKVYFQFGNEIQNPNGFYGHVCNWVTNNVTDSCDLDTQFIPTYVERYLAPGVSYLEEKSQELYGQPDAIRMVLGSLVNLANQETFLNSLLEYQVRGDFAPSLAGKHVYELVDTISIHYTIAGPTWRTTLDDFRNKYVPDGVPIGRVHRVWATEEVGAGLAAQGYGMASVLRGIARYLTWWQANNISPDDGHMFVWGANIKNAPDEICTACTSVDDEMPRLTEFTGSRALLTQTNNLSTMTASPDMEMYEFDVEGVDKRIVIMFPTGMLDASISGASIDLSEWSGKSVSVSAYVYANQGAVPISVTPINSTAGAEPLDLSLSVTLDRSSAVLLLIEGATD